MFLLNAITPKNRSTDEEQIRIIKSWCISFSIREYQDGAVFVWLNTGWNLQKINEYPNKNKALYETTQFLMKQAWELCSVMVIDNKKYLI